MANKIYLGDNLSVLKNIPDNSIDLIYTDPPFNTGKIQKRKLIETNLSENGLLGFGGNKYERTEIADYGSFNDKFDNYIDFLKPRMQEAHRILKQTGSIYLHLDFREVHYAKVMMDEVFGRDNFINEIIWSYEWGAKSRTKWSAKHDNILFYAKDKKNYTFNFDKVPRVPYLAPGLAGKEKAAIGKTICDVWTHTIVCTNSKEKQNYATQKPLGILRRIVQVSSSENDLCLDMFAGSGSFGAACLENNRKFIMIDSNKEAIDVMKRRFDGADVAFC